MTRIAFLIAALFMLTSCGTTPTPEPEIRIVPGPPVIVRVPCIAELPTPPEFPDTDEAIAAAPDGALAGLYVAGRLLRIDWIKVLTDTLSGCRQTVTSGGTGGPQ